MYRFSEFGWHCKWPMACIKFARKMHLFHFCRNFSRLKSEVGLYIASQKIANMRKLTTAIKVKNTER